MNLPSITSAVEAIAKEAGAFLRTQQSTFSRERVSLKSLNALVSDVDENTERLIVERLDTFGTANRCSRHGRRRYSVSG